MAATDFGALTGARKVVWAMETWKHGRDQSFFFSSGFIGKSDGDKDSLITRVTKLTETERGQECVMQLVQDLQGDGVVGDNQLSGNEEALVNDSQTIRIDQLRHGTKSKGEMAEQATVIRFRAQSKDKLGWWVAEKVDELMFLTVSGRSYTLKTNGTTRTNSQLPSLSFAADVAAPSANRILYAGTASSEGTLTAADKMSWQVIVKAKAAAARRRLRPLRDGGKSYYCILMSSEQERDLVLDPTYQTIVSRAAEKGSKNPLFMGALAVVQGVVLYSHNKAFNTLGMAANSKWGAGGTVDGAQAQLFGAQAAGIAMLGNPFWREAEVTDYGNRPGIGVGRKIGMLKPRFISPDDGGTREDFGTIAIKTAAAA